MNKILFLSSSLFCINIFAAGTVICYIPPQPLPIIYEGVVEETILASSPGVITFEYEHGRAMVPANKCVVHVDKK